MSAEAVADVAADHLHNYPDFKRDFAKGFFLGEDKGKYYFWNNGIITQFEGEYHVANNVSNYFSGPIVGSNGVRYYPPKMVLEAFVREQTIEALDGEGFDLQSSFPFPAEALCLETLHRVEKALPLSEGINGWPHFLVRLQALAVGNQGKIVQMEGIDHYLFISEESMVLQFATAEDIHTFKWKFAEEVVGFKVGKKLLIKLIERQKFS